MEALVQKWCERVREASAAKKPLRVIGGGTKDFYGEPPDGERFETTAYAGIVDYDPTELVVTVRAGTRLAELESTLAGGNQMLGFEPPYYGPDATIGGCLGSGLSGPRRPYAGAVRDLVLGVRVIDGRGDDLSFGGRVMKNVAGFDVSRLMVGSMGTLGIIVEASLKCLPLPRAETTLTFERSGDEGLRDVNQWGGLPLPLSATCWHDGRLYVRLSGAQTAVDSATRRLGGEPLPDAAAFWSDIRDHRHAFFAAGRAHSHGSAPPSDFSLWRLSVRSTAPFVELGGAQLIEWGGALRWLRAVAGHDAAQLRAWAHASGGHATLFRGGDDRAVTVFHPLPPTLMALHTRVKAAMDPAGIFNPRRMYQEL
jgi:glycolate dehydrogenase FAD-binding subunit